jgi:hypothetical protein
MKQRHTSGPAGGIRSTQDTPYKQRCSTKAGSISTSYQALSWLLMNKANLSRINLSPELELQKFMGRRTPKKSRTFFLQTKFVMPSSREQTEAHHVFVVLHPASARKMKQNLKDTTVVQTQSHHHVTSLCRR